MSKIGTIFEWLRECPQLSGLYSIGATEEVGNSVVFPAGSSSRYSLDETLDVVDGYEGDLIPLPSVYEDYQINCFVGYDTKDTAAPEYNVNVLTFDEVQAVCDWVAQQDEIGHLPVIEGKQMISVECNPFVPQIRYVSQSEGIVAYFITIRVTYVNTAKRRSVYYGAV